MRPILLDTCALIWLANNDRLSSEAEAALAEADGVAGGILISPISAWEIGQLVARGRLSLSVEPLQWFNSALETGLALAAMTPDVLVSSSFLPGGALRDPADRIMASTARAYRYRLMTRDRLLLDYAEAGHLQSIAC